MNNEILLKVDELLLSVEKSSDYQKYLMLQDEIKKNKEVTRLINEVRVLQKDVTHHLDKRDLLEEKQKELEDNPLYREYQNVVAEINNTFAIIESTINNYFYHKLN